jgi:acyl carrier protein
MTTSKDTTVDVHTKLHELWCAALKVDEIPNDADFFALGGSSLEAVVVTAKASKALGKKVPVRLLLSSPVLADYVDEVQAFLDDVGEGTARP